MKNCAYYITGLLLALLFVSCSYSKKFTNTYYQKNDSLFQSMQRHFKYLYEERPFSIEMRDKDFQRVGFEIITDTIKYIYSFGIDELRLTDTLVKYKFDVNRMKRLIADMQSLHCTWITNLDYYENRQKKYLVFISIRHKELQSFLRSEKYFTIAFFDRPRRFDNKGRLLDNQDRKTLHKINGGLFWKINDRVCYSLSASYR
ncbi:MAG: hypothetical protein ABIR18_11510 [Chitinophagaceae bacterium]